MIDLEIMDCCNSCLHFYPDVVITGDKRGKAKNTIVFCSYADGCRHALDITGNIVDEDEKE